MKVAVAQISCSLGDADANLLKVRDFTRRAKDEADAELIVFPEMTDTGYSMPVVRANANHWKSGFVPGLQQIARKLSIAIVAGVSERDSSSIYNSQVLRMIVGNFLDVLIVDQILEQRSKVGCDLDFLCGDDLSSRLVEHRINV